MLARCARCQGTFTTDRFGIQTCPICGAEVLLADPKAPPGGAPPPPPGAGPTTSGEHPAGPAVAGGPGGAEPPSPPAAPSPPPAAAPPATPPIAGTGGGWGAPPPPPAGGAPGWGAPPPWGWGPPAGGGWPPPGGGWGGYPPPPPPAVPSLPAPFAERAPRGFFRAFFETLRLVAFEPARFFRQVRIDQTGSAVLFGVIASTVGLWASDVWGYLLNMHQMEQLQQNMDKLPPALQQFFRLALQTSSPRALLAQLVAAPLIAVVRIYLGAAILHVLLLLFRGAGRGFDATLTAVAFVNGLWLLGVVPFFGTIVAAVWVLVALIIGLGEIQRCGSGKAAAAVLTPLVLACVCACAVGIVASTTILKTFQSLENGGGTSL